MRSESNDVAGAVGPERQVAGEPVAGEPVAGEDGRWVDGAVAGCLEVWTRIGLRYARRLAQAHLLRDPAADVLALAARRALPLQDPVRRPLPWTPRDPIGRAFDRLDPADRFVLMGRRELAPVRGARAEHLAAAYERLALAACLDDATFADGPDEPEP